jgi:hypothetical protein
VSDYLIVSPSPSLCPLDVVSTDTYASESCHNSLLDNLVAGGVGEHIPVSTWRSTDHNDSLEAIVATERKITELGLACWSRGADYTSYVSAQLALSTNTIPAENNATSVDMQEYRRLLNAVLGCPSLDDLDDVTRTLIIATPIIRARMLWESENRTLSECRRLLQVMPRVLLALNTMMGLARKAGMSRVTYQSVMKLFTEYSGLLWVLGRLDYCLVWRPDAFVDMTFRGDETTMRAYARIAKALLPRSQYVLHLPLGVIINDNLNEDGLERVVFLKQLATKIAGKVIDCDHSRDRSRRKLAARFQQWMMGRLPVESLTVQKPTK